MDENNDHIFEIAKDNGWFSPDTIAEMYVEKDELDGIMAKFPDPEHVDKARTLEAYSALWHAIKEALDAVEVLD